MDWRGSTATASCLGLGLWLLSGCAEEIRPSPKPEASFHGRTTNQWIEALRDPNPVVRFAAAGALGEIRDPVAVPVLIEALKDENAKVGYAAAFSLGKTGSDAVPDLLAVLKEKSPKMRELAGIALWKMGRGATAAVPALGKVLANDESIAVRLSAAAALGNTGPEGVPALVGALKDLDPGVRREAALSLGRIGPDARGTLSALRAVQEGAEEDEDVREAATEALEKILAGP